MMMNHEVLMRAFDEAQRKGTLMQWRALADEFIKRQDMALRDARKGLVEALEQLTAFRTELARQIEPLRQDKTVFGVAFCQLTADDTLERIDPRRITIGPEQ